MSKETRHSHGGTWHDHPEGGTPHDHGPGQPGGYKRFNPYQGEALITLGIVALVIGGILLLLSSNDHATCNSVLAQAVAHSQCSRANLAWTGGWLLVIGGALATVTGVIRRGQRRG